MINKITGPILLLLPILLFGQMIDNYDALPDSSYWGYDISENADSTLSFVNVSYVTDPVSEGAGAMQLDYSAHNIEAWGGYAKIAHMLVGGNDDEPGEDTGIVFAGAFGGTVVDGNTYTFPTGAEAWGGFSNEDTTIYPFSFPGGGTISFTGATAGTDVDVYFRFEYNPYPDVDPSYNTAAVTVSGTAETSYSVDIPAQGANTYSSFLLYVVTQDAPVTLTNVAVTSGIVFSGPFAGAVVDGNTYTFPTGADPWAGFANEDTTIYPFNFTNDGTITFTGATAGTVDSVDVYFRFEYNPYPDVEPSYNTATVTVIGSEASSYSVEIPAQGPANTYSSFLFYVVTPDAPVTITNVNVLNNVTVTSGIVFAGPFGGAVVDSNTYTFPTGADPWAGFANEDTTIYPFSFPGGGTITFTGATAGTDADVYFRFEYNPYPDVDPSYNTAAVTVSGTAETSYSVDIPAQGANTYSSFLLYVTTPDAPVTLTNVTVTVAGSALAQADEWMTILEASPRDHGDIWDWSGYDSISFSYYNSVPQTLENRVHLRLNLSDFGDIADPANYAGLGEYYYSFHYILDNAEGWNTITMPLERNDSWDGGGFNLTGWSGDAGNGEVDKDAIAGFHLEFSISGGGDGDYSGGTIILDDFKLTGSLNILLNGSFEDGMDFWDTFNVNENISIETTGNNIYNSSAIFEAYNGEQALKMWGANNDNSTFTWVGQWLEVGSGGLEIGSLIMLDGMMMSHADDWIGQGANYSCLALYFYDADMTTYVGGQYMALSEYVDANAPSSEWLYRNVIAEIPEGTVWAWAGVEYYQPSNDDHGSVYIDMLAMDYNVTDIFVDISFNFDMKNKNPDETGVYVAGSFNGWSTSDTQLFDDDGDEVYSVTLNLQGGSTIEYKFLNGNYWGEPGETHDVVNDPVCGTGDNGNRFYHVPYENAEIAPVCMNSCEDCTEDMNYDLADNWSVVTSFTREDVGEIFSQIQSNGRTVIGGMDLDEDGSRELILTDYAGHRVLVYEYLTSDGSFEQVWSSPIIENTNHDDSPRTVGIGDLDGDSKQEIVFPVSVTGQEGWYIFEWNGVVGSDDYGDTYSSINSVELDVCCIDDASAFRGDHERTTIDDIDGDGQQELVIMIRRGDTRGTLITSVTGDIVHNAGGSGSEVWASEGFVNSDDYGGGSPYHSLPADLDGDGTVELVNHTWQNFNFYNIDVTGADTYVAATPGSDDSHYQASQYDNVSLFGGAAADIDNDGNEECFFPVFIIDGGEGDEGGLYLIDYDENDDILQINGSHVHKIVESETSLLYASIFDINGSQSPNIFTGSFDGKAIEIMSTEYLGGSLTSTGSYGTQNIFSLENIYNVTVYDSAGVITNIDTSYSGYLSKVQSNINGLPIDFDDDGYKELLVSTPGMMSSYTVLTLTWNGSDWDETSSETIENMLHPVVSLIEYQGYQYPNIISSVASVSAVHGDTVLVEIELGIFAESLQSLDMSFSGFQDKLIFHDIVTDGYIFGNLGWFTQVNNTDELLITASAGANLITGNGVIFALELIVPDTLSTQFVPIVISDFLGNTDITDGTFSDGGVEVVWEPTANFISDTTTGYLPLVISFTDTSEIGTYPVNQWSWDFGDDSVATGANVQHTYTQEGQYTVTLTITDEFGLSDTLVMDDYIDALHPIYPVAGFSASVTSGDYPLNVTFTDTSSVGTYEINNWLWDFGNDSTGSGSSVSMSYQRPGEFDVTLMITDEYGLNDTLISSSIIQVDTTFGDVDWNTAVQSFDASLILQDLVELIELDSLQMLIGDVSGDSSLSTLDATLILQYVVGLIDELPYNAGTQYMATGDLNMDDQGIDPGMQIEIPIHISNGSNIYGFTGTINYDHTILNYDTLLLSDYLEGYLMAFNELSPGEIKIAASGNNPDGETGVFATMVFYVTDAFTDETSISITDLTWNEGEMIEVAAEMSITYGLGIDGVSIPDVYALHQNYPNPFNPTTQIKYDLPEDAMVSITIYDIMGRSISSLVNSKQTAGYRSIQWNAINSFGESVSAGMYIYTIQAGEFRQTKKMVLLK